MKTVTLNGLDWIVERYGRHDCGPTLNPIIKASKRLKLRPGDRILLGVLTKTKYMVVGKYNSDNRDYQYYEIKNMSAKRRVG